MAASLVRSSVVLMGILLAACAHDWDQLLVEPAETGNASVPAAGTGGAGGVEVGGAGGVQASGAGGVEAGGAGGVEAGGAGGVEASGAGGVEAGGAGGVEASGAGGVEAGRGDRDAGGSDAPHDVAAEPVPTCEASTLTYCPGAGCIDLDSNRNNCGACAWPCPAVKYCSHGICIKP